MLDGVLISTSSLESLSVVHFCLITVGFIDFVFNCLLDCCFLCLVPCYRCGAVSQINFNHLWAAV